MNFQKNFIVRTFSAITNRTCRMWRMRIRKWRRKDCNEKRKYDHYKIKTPLYRQENHTKVRRHATNKFGPLLFASIADFNRKSTEKKKALLFAAKLMPFLSARKAYIAIRTSNSILITPLALTKRTIPHRLHTRISIPTPHAQQHPDETKHDFEPSPPSPPEAAFITVQLSGALFSLATAGFFFSFFRIARFYLRVTVEGVMIWGARISLFHLRKSWARSKIFLSWSFPQLFIISALPRRPPRQRIQGDIIDAGLKKNRG